MERRSSREGQRGLYIRHISVTYPPPCRHYLEGNTRAITLIAPTSQQAALEVPHAIIR